MSQFKGLKVKAHMGEYTLKQQLAEGGFAMIYTTDNNDVICKMQNLSMSETESSYKREKGVLMAVKHSNIVRLVDWADVEFKDVKFGALFLQNCSKGSNLFKLIESTNGDVQQQIILNTFYSVASALQAMHKYGYSHRDIKLENILINKSGQFKLCDFGSATEKIITEVNNNNRVTIEQQIEKNTTPIYRSPEQLDLYSKYEIGPKVDIFSLGCVIFMMCFKKQPFEMRLSAINNHYFMPQQSIYSQQLKDLIRKCFTPNPQERPSASILVNELKPLLSATASKVRKSDNKYQLDLNNQIERVIDNFQHVRAKGKDSAEPVKSSLFGRMKRVFTQMTTQTEYWIENFIEESEEGPPLKCNRNIIAKCWQKRYKVEKVYSIILQSTNQNINRCLVMLKILILLHNFLKKGPREAIVGSDSSSSSQSTAVKICMSIYTHWRKINANDRSEDLKRDPFISLVIQYYSLILIAKVKLCDTYVCFIEGNYCPLPYFLNSADQKILSPAFIEDLLDFLGKVIELHEKIEMMSSLPQIQRTIILSLVDEEYCLISFLVHLYCTFKQSTNYLYNYPNLDAQKLEHKVQELDNQIVGMYSRLLKMMETDAAKYAQEMGGQFVRLQYEVIGHIKGIKILQLQSDRVTFNLQKFFSFDKDLYGLTLPHTYEDVFNSAMANVQKGGYSGNGENFLDVSAFKKQKPLDREEHLNKVNQNVESSSQKVSKIIQPLKDPKPKDVKPQQPSKNLKISQKQSVVYKPEVVSQDVFGNTYFSKKSSIPDKTPANFDNFLKDADFMEFSHQNLNKDFSSSRIQERIASSNTIAEYFVQNPPINQVPTQPTELIMFDMFASTKDNQQQVVESKNLDINKCELIRFDDDDSQQQPTLKLQEVMKPASQPTNEAVNFNIQQSSQSKKHNIDRLSSIQIQNVNIGEYNINQTISPRSPSTNIKGFIMEEVSKSATQFLIDLQELEFNRKVGSGTSSEVFQGSWRGQEVAIKKIKLANPNLVKEFERQIMTCVKIRPHPHLAAMIGVSERSDLQEMYIVSEFCHGGTLFELLHETKIPVLWANKVSIAKQIAKGMLFLHSNQPPTIHRDLKSLNILLTDPYTNENDKIRIKIGDFGLSREMAQDFMTGSLGTYHWMAPEIFNNQQYSTKADVYSFAIVLWEIITRRLPYKNIEHAQAIMKFVTVENGRPQTNFISSKCPKELKDLMIKCWDSDPRRRPEFKQILYILGTISMT